MEFDWNGAFDSALGAGVHIWDQERYTEQERAQDQLTAEQLRIQREMLAANQSGGLGGMDPTTLAMIGGALVLVVVLVK